MSLDLLTTLATEGDNSPVKRALAAIREHLNMAVAYVSQFQGDRVIFREVDAPDHANLIRVGDTRALNETYCRYILEGRLPELMADTGHYELARALPVTLEMPIGSHMSVPIVLPEGRIYGMLCCLSPRSDRSLNERDLKVLRVFADMVAGQIANTIAATRHSEVARARVDQVIAKQQFDIVYQEIVDLRSNRSVGFEALCRFSAQPHRTPDVWFSEAAEVGRAVELEAAVIAKAIEALDVLPAELFLSVNASPDCVLDGELVEVLKAVPKHRLVLELTEHARVSDYNALDAALRPLREGGLRLAVDDAGAGYASLQHIIQLHPDFIKLDMSLTRDLDSNPSRRALTSALIFFAQETGSTIIAEGIETETEGLTLERLGVPLGQGFLLGKPHPLTALRHEPAPKIVSLSNFKKPVRGLRSAD